MKLDSEKISKSRGRARVFDRQDRWRFEKKLKTPMGAGVAAMKGGGNLFKCPPRGAFHCKTNFR
jgi:hypothetical protein